MQEWKCTTCGCVYNWSEPVMVRGRPYCGVCSRNTTTSPDSGAPGRSSPPGGGRRGALVDWIS